MKKFLIVILIGLVAFGYFSAIYSQERTPAQKWSDAEKALKNANDRMKGLNRDLAKYKAEYTEKGGNALTAAVTMWNPIDAIKTLFTGRGTPNRVWELKTLMISIYIQQEDLNQTLGLLDDARDTAYEEYKKTTSQPADQINQPDYAEIPNISLPCLNRCGTVYNSSSVGLGNLADKALMGHGVYCSSDPHKGYWYYSCPPNYGGCPASDKHHIACRDGCGEKGPVEQGWFSVVTIRTHLKRCSEKIEVGKGIGRRIQPCPKEYYQCNGQTSDDCPYADLHVSGSTPPTGGTTNPPPSNPSPSYHPCDVHLTSVSGDHSLQASCSSSNENGNCTVTNFYACDGHTHTYPEPTLVACGRRACTERVSERNKHRTDPCSACNGSYWSCGPHADYHYNQHRERTCRRMGCGQQWRRCQGPTPSCSVAAGQGCWAQ